MIVFRGDYPHAGPKYDKEGQRVAIFFAFGDQDTEGVVFNEHHRDACVETEGKSKSKRKSKSKSKSSKGTLTEPVTTHPPPYVSQPEPRNHL